MTPEIRATLVWALSLADTLTNAGPAWDAAKMGQRIQEARTWLEARPAVPAPDWSTAPEWAQWWAVDADGMAFWYDAQPVMAFGETLIAQWRKQSEREWPMDWIDLPLGIDWRTTLRKRPE